MNPQYTNNNPTQFDVDTACAAELRGRHEQQLVNLEKAQEVSNAILRQDVGELRKDIKDVMIVISKTIDDNHRALMESNANTDTKIDAMGIKVSKVTEDVIRLQEKTTDHDDSIKELRGYVVGIISTFIAGIIGVITWLVNKYPLHFGQ